MKNEVRRKDRQLTDRNEMLRILDSAEYGVLSLVDEENVPYGIPLHFARRDDRLIFHCAPEGRKLECLRFQPRVSFCVVGRARVLPGRFTTEYDGIVVGGIAEIIDDEDRKTEDLMILCRKLSPGYLDAAKKMIEKHLPRTEVFEVRIETIAGKAMQTNDRIPKETEQ